MKTQMPQYIIGKQLSVQRALKNALSALETSNDDQITVAIDDIKTILENVIYVDPHSMMSAQQKLAEVLQIINRPITHDTLDADTRGA